MSHKVFNVRARAPLRLGLAGRDTDLSPYCYEYGGAIVNSTIDRFAYAHVVANDDGKTIFRAQDIGEEETVGCCQSNDGSLTRSPTRPRAREGLRCKGALLRQCGRASLLLYLPGDQMPLLSEMVVDLGMN